VRPRVDEIHGLLYYAVHESEALAIDAPDPTRPLALSVYADGDPNPTPDWPARVKHLNAETPLIVFSKARRLLFFGFPMAVMADCEGGLENQSNCVSLSPLQTYCP